MKPNKPSKQIKQDKARQQEIEQRLKAEKVELDHPQGKEQFSKVMANAVKKDQSKK
jgi:hypothetical protein